MGYFYLICFATYAKEQGPTMFPKSFVAWMDEHKDLREMIANGKDKLEWSRQVDQNAVNELRGKVSGADYKDKLGEVVTSLYKISHNLLRYAPRGDQGHADEEADLQDSDGDFANRGCWKDPEGDGRKETHFRL